MNGIFAQRRARLLSMKAVREALPLIIAGYLKYYQA